MTYSSPDLWAGASLQCLTCLGKGEVWKYFKNEEEKCLYQVYDYCPTCFPAQAQPIVPSEGQVEIDYREFDELSREPGWIVD